MRALTKRQKDFLDKWLEEHKEEMRGNIVDDVMSMKDWKTLKKMNDTEILYQNVERYLWDNFAII